MVKVPDGLRPDLATAVERETVLFGAKKSLQAASAALRDDERVLEATTAARFVGGKLTDNGVLIVTDQRLLFVHARLMAVATEEIPLANISGLTDRRGMTSGHITVTGAGGITTEFRNITKNRVDPVANCIRTHLAKPGTTTAPAPAAGDDLVGQLERLAALHTAGHLSDDEFAAQKARLLAQ